METGDFSYLVDKLWGLSSSFIISIIFMPVGVGVRISNVITLNRLQSFIITHCCTMIIGHYLSMFQNCNWKSHFGRKLWQLIGVDKVQWWASMIALPIFSSSACWPGVVRVRGCGVWRRMVRAGPEEAHITALGHSQATTLTLAVATFAHCHNV